MTTDTITADDLAAALREALPYVVDLADYVREASEEGYRDSWEADSTLESVHRWQYILDRFDAQRRAEIDQLVRDRDQYMRLARRMNRGDWPTRYVRQARAVNHQALALRRQFRALGGEA